MGLLNYIFVAPVAVALTWASAHAETRIDQKILQYGGPESRTRCVNMIHEKTVPECKVRGVSLKGVDIVCEDRWTDRCGGWATDFMQHEVFLSVTGPDVQDALKSIIEDAVKMALAAAATAAVVTPGEAAIKIAAAISAFQTTLTTEFQKNKALAELASKYNVSIRTKSDW